MAIIMNNILLFFVLSLLVPFSHHTIGGDNIMRESELQKKENISP